MSVCKYHWESQPLEGKYLRPITLRTQCVCKVFGAIILNAYDDTHDACCASTKFLVSKRND